MNKYFLIIIIAILPITQIRGQESAPERFIQLSGIVTDVLYRPVAGVGVISKKLHRASITEPTGIYSITTVPGDTVYFRALGFKRYHTIIPPLYEDKRCMVDIVLETDTIPISEVTILPWKNYGEFLKEMTREKKVDRKIEYMNENIASIYVAVQNQTGVKISADAGFKYAMEQNFSAMATRGQYPVNNLLNPIAWVKFVNGVKNGMFKNQTFKKPEPAKVAKKKKKRGGR